MAIRIVIADAADLMILGAQQALLTDHRMEVVGTARSLTELLSRLPGARPDAVLVGAYLHGADDIIQISDQIKTR
jgi:DNA-binding NarL/FixJ family response regulator